MRHESIDHPDEASTEWIVERKVRELIVDIAVHDDHVRMTASRASEHLAQVDGVEQIQAMTRDREIPLAHVLIATFDRLFRGANAWLATQKFMDESFAVTLSDDDIVPKRQRHTAQTPRPQVLLEIGYLCALTGAIEPREGDQQWTIVANVVRV